jgi:tetratricopeptide (TPR) repeat protein
MNCPSCGSPLTKKNKCDRCGTNVSLIQKSYRISNYFYNKGLEKAKIRDLTGTIFVLQKSLKFNKENTNARNLLGLVYYEMGEIVAALSEWVLSKHFQPKDNDADIYINDIQANPTRLETANQTIKKYNAALMAAKQGNDDLAIIQLKKVTNLNHHFLRAHHLLALLYMRNNEKEKAYRLLQKIKKIDVTNTTTLRYLSELAETQEQREGRDTKDTKDTQRVDNGNDNLKISPVSTYREEKPNIWVFLNLIIGVVIGVGLLYFLVVPNVKKQTSQDYNSKIVDLNSDLAVQTKTITTLENDKEDLQKQIDQLNTDINKMKEESKAFDETLYDDLFAAIKSYVAKEGNDAIIQKLLKVDISKIERQSAVDVYNTLKDELFPAASASIYEDGHNKYTNRKYEEAIQILQSVVDINADKVPDALYFIGRSYQMLSDKENASKFYNEVIDKYPDTERADQAKSKLQELQ